MRKPLLLILLVLPCLAATMQCPQRDVTVEPGTYTFAEFQQILDDAVAAGDLDGSGHVDVYLKDGVHVVNAADANDPCIEIPGDNVRIFALVGSDVGIRNERLGPDNTATGALCISDVGGTRIENIAIHTSGYWGEGVAGERATVAGLHGLAIETKGDYAWGIKMHRSSVNRISGTVITTQGHRADGIMVLYDGAVHAIDGLEIRRSVGATEDATAIYVNNLFYSGGSEYFNSPYVTNVTVCSEAGCLHKWEDHSQGASAGIVADDDWETPVSPLSHNPYDPNTPGPYGAQTFPFDDHGGTGLQLGLQGGAVAGQNIILGGTCAE